MDMGGWLGFSLSPHHHDHHHPNHHTHHQHHPQHQENHQNHLTSTVSENNRTATPSCYSNEGFEAGTGHVSGAGFGFPLGVNEPFCIMEPFRSNDWRFSSPMNSNNSNNSNAEENKCPKLENFLGGYTENSSAENNSFQHPISPFNEIYYQTINLGSNSNNNCSHHDEINVNMPLTFPNSPLQRQTEEDIRYPFRYLIQNTQNSPSLDETDHLKSHYNLLPATNFQILDNNPPHNHTASVYDGSVGLDAGSTSISGFKSWLRQNAYAAAGEKQMVEEEEEEGDGNKPSIYNSLSLSMNPIPINTQPPLLGNDIFCPAQTPPMLSLEDRKRPNGKSINRDSNIPRKSIESFGQRTSQYRGVTRHRWTGRYEAHLWDNSCRKEGQTRKGRQVYLGGYDREEKAARAYDLAALKYWGSATHINFALGVYEKEMEEMKSMTRQEFVASLRRKSSGFSRGASIYRGVTRHHQHGRWQARIGRVAGNKDLYLGTFGTQEKAAEAYDIAAIKFRGLSAVTNFDISRYHVERICSSDTLISADLARRSPKTDAVESVEDSNGEEQTAGSSDLPNKTIKSHHSALSTIMEKPVETAVTSLPLMDQYGDYSHAFFSILEPKGDNSEDADASTPMRTSGFPPLHQFPAMFALWNE